MDLVYVKFPKTGLGNLLLIWARARVFAHLNDLPIVTSPWWGIRLGAWLRKEQKKRIYWGYFKESSWIQLLKINIMLQTREVISDPPIKKNESSPKESKRIYLFNEVVRGNDLFEGLRECRDFIKSEILSLLSPKLINKLAQYQDPYISVHIRRGDFKIGNQITPTSFYTNAILNIRTAVKQEWPVTVFTDAEKEEIKDVLSLPNVHLAEAKADILDILIMSRSKAIVLSQSSTFSYWGAFLSDAIVFMHRNDWQKTITGNLSREIRIDECVDLQHLSNKFN